ncbi:MAG: UDP-N-acetylmuramoyl-L-alanyl-D-glutamate--2,6-diaminopimelate ligase [Bacteroidales bacterium]|nr:UDP-N-acetylmuramoyl-L-alanyl-D-glutamate--2,6-diaminopimelate ligase [Bacteroidales bacterium]
MKIKEIIVNCNLLELIGDKDLDITRVSFDSRTVEPGTLFFAVKGTQVDGHDYIEKAVEKGASAIVCEKMPEKLHPNVTYIRVDNSAYVLGVGTANFYGNPSHKLKLVGVTGTNGKTTIATLLYRLFTDAGYACGLLSTIENIIDREVIPSTHTTPDPIELNELLNKMVEHQCEYAFMEVSSHSIDQNRIAGLQFAGGIFTNLTRDHLDYHKTMANYRNAKKKFFDDLPANAFALTNLDDKNGSVMLQNTKAKKLGYALKHDADFKGLILESHFDGMMMKVNDTEMFTRLVGNFNASNILAIYGAAVALGFDKDELLVEISKLKGANGRFDMIQSDCGIVGIVDYAHTPDALENVLKTINEVMKTENGTPKGSPTEREVKRRTENGKRRTENAQLSTLNSQLITVVGCGGNRDAGKRPQMAAAAVKLSDKVILTSDNPRDEDPDEIIRQMKEGIAEEALRKVLCITDRREAIRTATALAKKGDIILLAGKGHEDYQIIKGVKRHFDDKEELTKALKER